MIMLNINITSTSTITITLTTMINTTWLTHYVMISICIIRLLWLFPSDAAVQKSSENGRAVSENCYLYYYMLVELQRYYY